MKKVLIIAYYWPPTGGGGVYRWVKFVKYLRDYGWEPIVYTPSNPEAGIRDESLLKDIPSDITILKRKITEPYSFYKVFTGKKKKSTFDNFVKTNKSTGNSLKEKISIWIRGNLFIPDARCWWIKPSVRFLRKWLKEHPVDVIVSTGPPHSMHMIGLKTVRNSGIPWLADFRDPWTNIDFYHLLRLSGWADRKHRKLERRVLQTANRVVTVTPSWGELMKELGAQSVHVVNNGYDSEDFEFLPIEQDKEFSITHVGSLNGARNPIALWNALSEICNENIEFKSKLKLRFLGAVDYSVKENLKTLNLIEQTEFCGYVTHDEALKIGARSAVLLLLLNNTPGVQGIIPGKMYEYLASNRPILLIGPEACDSARILSETQSGYRAGFDDVSGIKQSILALWEDDKINKSNTDYQKIQQFSRKNLTEKLAKILDDMVR